LQPSIPACLRIQRGRKLQWGTKSIGGNIGVDVGMLSLMVFSGYIYIYIYASTYWIPLRAYPLIPIGSQPPAGKVDMYPQASGCLVAGEQSYNDLEVCGKAYTLFLLWTHGLLFQQHGLHISNISKPWRTRNRCRYRKIAAQMKSSFMVETLVQVVSVVYDCS